MKLLSHVQLFAIPWTVAYQAPPSMEFSRQKYWSGLPFPSPGDLPDPGIEPRFPTLQADGLLSEPPGKPLYTCTTSNLSIFCWWTFRFFQESCLTLCNPMDSNMPGFPVLHYNPELVQSLVYWVSDSIQPSHPLSTPPPPAISLSQHPGLFQWASAKVLALQHQSFQWIFRVDFL